MESNLDMSLDVGLEFDLEDLRANEIDFAFLDSFAEGTAAIGTTIQADSGNDDTANRPYHAKRPHKKSRAGCKQCKTRKVKCDEARPSCRTCTLRKEACVYPTTVSGSASSVRSKSKRAGSAHSRSPGAPREETPPPSPSPNNSQSLVLAPEPMYIPGELGDATDMKMLWFYTAETYHSFNIEGGRSGPIDHCLRVIIPQYAFSTPFLMQTLMGLSALNLKMLGQPVPANKAAIYRANAFEGYRHAVEAAQPRDYPGLLAASLLICGLSSEMFREEDTKPLYIVDWMVVWRGIGLIVDLVSPATIAESGLSVLFYRPPIDLDKSAPHVPNNLLFMVTSIKEGDDDYEYQQDYYEVLRCLGSLYRELETGFSPIMDLRVITFFTFLPRTFIDLAREHRPRALIILAHYCAFTMQNLGPWWMRNIGNKQIRQIGDLIDPSWEHLMRVPQRVTTLTDRVEIAKTILQNDTWTAPDVDLYAAATRDPRCRNLKILDDDGSEIRIRNGQWERVPPPKTAILPEPVTMDNKGKFLGKGHPLDPETASSTAFSASSEFSACSLSPFSPSPDYEASDSSPQRPQSKHPASNNSYEAALEASQKRGIRL